MLPQKLAQSALESAPDALVVADAAGAIVLANDQASRLFGYGREQLLGVSVEQLLPERFRIRHRDHRHEYGHAPRVRPMGEGIELAARRRDGSEFPVEISLSPIRAGDVTLVMAAIRDVTDRRRIESELRSAREAADRANQAKSRFLAMASHDLRQPLQALSFLNGALRRLPSQPGIAEALAQQEQAISAMSRLLNALLDISKLEAGVIKPELGDFTVNSIFEELRREFAGLAMGKGLELRVEACDDAVCSDRTLIEQILRNLLSNAIKYTQRGMVMLRCLHERSVVRLEVLDTGIGIPADKLPYIYDEFFQVCAGSNGARDGYGLGLSIVNRLVNLLGVKLDVTSELGRGSSFRLQLPRSARKPDACVVRESAGSGSTGCAHTGRMGLTRRVLLIEDDPGVRMATRLLLEAEGFGVVTASSGTEAQHVLTPDAPLDLIITDFHLGGAENGIDVIARLRKQIGARLPAILVSGDTSHAVRGLQLDERLRSTSKPVQAERLLALMNELLEEQPPCA